MINLQGFNRQRSRWWDGKTLRYRATRFSIPTTTKLLQRQLQNFYSATVRTTGFRYGGCSRQDSRSTQQGKCSDRSSLQCAGLGETQDRMLASSDYQSGFDKAAPSSGIGNLLNSRIGHAVWTIHRKLLKTGGARRTTLNKSSVSLNHRRKIIPRERRSQIAAAVKVIGINPPGRTAKCRKEITGATRSVSG